MTLPGHCPHCGCGVFVAKSGKAKMRTSILVVHQTGEVESNCPGCRKAILLPMHADLNTPLKKSKPTRFVVALDSTNKLRT